MSTIFNVRNLKLPSVTRTALIVGSLIVVLAVIAGIVGWQLYKKLIYNTVVVYFPQTLALYPGDKVDIMGVRVGSIDSIEPAGDKMKVTFTTRTSTRFRRTPRHRSSTRAWCRRAASSCPRPTPAGP